MSPPSLAGLLGLNRVLLCASSPLDRCVVDGSASFASTISLLSTVSAAAAAASTLGLDCGLLNTRKDSA